MINIKDTTLVCIDSISIRRAIKAIKNTLKICSFEETILFSSSEARDKIFPGLRLEEANIRSPKDYSEFVLFELHKFVKTKHVMIIQWDGFPIKENSWSDEFLNYDFIGAPWFLGGNSVHLMPECTEKTLVGNGGFSIRSLKLMKEVAALEVTLPTELEDVYICRGVRKQLDEKGFKFAPTQLARLFSAENVIYSNQFGFHGRSTISMNENLKAIIESEP